MTPEKMAQEPLLVWEAFQPHIIPIPKTETCMEKFLCAVVATLFVGAAHAQNINGNWTASQVFKNNELVAGGGGGLRYQFSNGQFTSKAPGGDKSGTYSIGGGRLDLNFGQYTLNCSVALQGNRLTYAFRRGSDVVTVVLTRD